MEDTLMKKVKFFIIVFMLLLSWYGHVSAMQVEGCGAGECKDCHSLSVQEASKLFKGFVDRVTDTKQSQVPGLWEVTVEKGDKKGIVLIDYSKSFIIDGRIIPLKEKIKLDFSKIPLSDSIIMGNPESSHKVVVFTDPDCKYCAKLHKVIKEIIKDKKNNIAFYIKLYPLKTIHPEAYAKSKVIVCSPTPLVLLDHVFQGKKLATEKTCKTSIVDDNLKLAQKLGIRSTPTMILENGRIIRGHKDAPSIISFVNSVKKDEKKKEDTKKEAEKK